MLEATPFPIFPPKNSTNRTAPSTSGVWIPVRPSQIASAKGFGLARTVYHDGKGRTPSADLGKHGNARADCWGALGELVPVDALELAGYHPTDFHPFTLAFQSEEDRLIDFRLNSIAYDCKAVPPDTPFVTVNEKKRLRYVQAGVLLLPVWFPTPKRAVLLRPLTGEEVGQWSLRQGRTPYRSVAVSKLAPLASWNELSGGRI